MKRTLVSGMVSASLLFLAIITQGAAQTGDPVGKMHAHPAGKPEVIYIRNFEIEASGISQGGRLGGRLPRLQQNPEEEAHKLVEVLASALTEELQNRKVPARRLYPGEDMPHKGWLVKGEFLEVDEGNRLRRAAIGFGAGSTEMLAEMSIFDLYVNRYEPFLVSGTGSKSGGGPGALVMMNPYAAAAKFVLSKRASERDVKKIARQIADVITRSFEDAVMH